MNESLLKIFVYCLRTERVDIHGVTTDKVFDSAFELRRTVYIVGTIGCRFAGITYQGRTTLRTTLDEAHAVAQKHWPLVMIDSYNLRNDFASFLHINLVANMQIELLHNVLIV